MVLAGKDPVVPKEVKWHLTSLVVPHKLVGLLCMRARRHAIIFDMNVSLNKRIFPPCTARAQHSTCTAQYAGPIIPHGTLNILRSPHAGVFNTSKELCIKASWSK